MAPSPKLSSLESKMSKLANLEELLVAATGPDRNLDGLIYNVLLGDIATGEMFLQRAFTASFDATLVLSGRLLPGWKWSAGYGCGDDGDNRRTVNLWNEKHWVQGEHDIDVIAFLLAIIAALIAQADGAK